MIRLLVATLLLVCSTIAHATCVPSSIFTNRPIGGEIGTDYIFVETPFVEGRVGWCLLSRTPAGDQWVPQVHQYCLKRLCPNALTAPLAIVDEIRSAASSPVLAASAAEARLLIKITDPVDRLRYQQWRWDACKALLDPANKLTPAPFDAAYLATNPCGTRPPDPAVETWKTITGSVFTAAGGKLTGLVSGKKVAAGLTCSFDIISATSGTRRFGAAPPTTAAGEVVECQKVTP